MCRGKKSLCAPNAHRYIASRSVLAPSEREEKGSICFLFFVFLDGFCTTKGEPVFIVTFAKSHGPKHFHVKATIISIGWSTTQMAVRHSPTVQPHRNGPTTWESPTNELNHRHCDVPVQQATVKCSMSFFFCNFNNKQRNERLIGGGALLECGNVVIYKNRLTWRICYTIRYRISFLVGWLTGCWLTHTLTWDMWYVSCAFLSSPVWFIFFFCWNWSTGWQSALFSVLRTTH